MCSMFISCATTGFVIELVTFAAADFVPLAVELSTFAVENSMVLQ